MQSVLDRRSRRIILRRNSETLLRHELAHLYIDTSWKVLPYPTSEPLAAALGYSGACNLEKRQQQNAHAVREAWGNLVSMTECERQQLFADVLSIAPEVREKLPLR